MKTKENMQQRWLVSHKATIFAIQPCADKVCLPLVERDPGGVSLVVVREGIPMAVTLK